MGKNKFRARCIVTENGKVDWRYGDLIEGRLGGTFIDKREGKAYKQYYAVPETVGRYTGLKDENEKEIFESDIIKRTSMAPGGIDFIGVVKYSECAFWIEKGTRAIPLFDEIDCLEVIGNIYENPKLLNA